MAEKTTQVGPRPVYLYDHLPGILAGYPAVLFLILALLSLPFAYGGRTAVVDAVRQIAEQVEAKELAPGDITQDTIKRIVDSKGLPRWAILSQHTIFWMALVITLVWYIAFRFNLPKRRFWLVFGLVGTFIGLPVVLEITTDKFEPFRWMGEKLGLLAPSANASAYFVLAVIFGVIWMFNFIWSRTHLSVKITTTGLTIRRVGGKGERFDLIGLKTEHEPLDYLETFVAGIGSLSLKTRMNKPIFTMKRVVSLYRVPIMPFIPGKLSRIEEILSYQGKVVSVDAHDQVDMVEAAEAEADDSGSLGEADEIDAQVDGEFGDGDGVETADSPDIK